MRLCTTNYSELFTISISTSTMQQAKKQKKKAMDIDRLSIGWFYVLGALLCFIIMRVENMCCRAVAVVGRDPIPSSALQLQEGHKSDMNMGLGTYTDKQRRYLCAKYILICAHMPLLVLVHNLT
jgi:hypothetical protein